MNSEKRIFRPFRTVAVFLLCICVAVSGTLPLAAYARDTKKTVRVGWYESPFNRTDQYGRRSGYAYDYQQKIAAYTGWEYEYVEGTWPNLMQMLIDGEIDLLSDVSYTQERTESMLFPSIPMGRQEYDLFVEPGTARYSSGNYNYFNRKRLGVNKGSVQAGHLSTWLQSHHIQAEIVELTCTAEEAFDLLKQGELDGYVNIDAYGTSGTAIPEIRIGSSEFFFAVSKSRPDLLQELETALTRIQDENSFYSQQLYQK